MAKIDKDSLAYLGMDYQLKLMAQILTDKKFANSIIDIIEPEYFEEQYIKIIAATIKDAKGKDEIIPDYGSLEIRLLEEQTDDVKRRFVLAQLRKIKEASLDDTFKTQDIAMRFCKQQELKKSLKEIQKIIDRGNLEEYEQCESILRKALEHGDNKDDGIDVFHDIKNVLKVDFRKPIRTGIKGLDEIMDGGLSKGELAVILAPFGVGKSQPLTSKILTPNGWTTMGDVKVGDYVISRDGNPTKVIGVYPQGVRPIYRVSFNDGTSTLCDEEHLWSVKYDGPYSVFKTSDLIGKLETKYYLPKFEAINFNDNANVDLIELATKISNGESVDVDINDIICNSLEKKMDFLNIICVKGIFNENDNVVIFKHSNISVLSLIREVFFSIGYKAIISDDKTAINLYEEQIERYISSIEYSHQEEAQCIMVENNEHLYITDDYIVTHNTTMMTKICNTAMNDGKKVLQIFFEDMPNVIQRKHLACWSGYDLNSLSLHEEQLQQMCIDMQNNTKGDTGELRLKKFSSDGTTIPMIRQYIRQQIAGGFRPDLVTLDYIDCVTPSKKFDDINAGEGAVMRQFESMLSELDLAGWTAVQGNRSSISAEVVEANQMGGSIKKGQIGHFIVSIAKTLDQKEDGTATMAILKSRFGKDGIVFPNIVFDNARIQIEMGDAQGGTRKQYKKDVDDNQQERLNALMEARKVVKNN